MFAVSGNTYEVSTGDGRVLTVEAEDEAQAKRAAAEFVMRNPDRGERPFPNAPEGNIPLSAAGQTVESLQAQGFVRGNDRVWRRPVAADDLGVAPTPDPEDALNPEAVAAARRAYGDVVPDQLAAFNQSATFNFNDEFAASLDGIGTRVGNFLTPGEDPYSGEEAEEASRFVQRENMGRFSEEHPVQDFVYRTAGALVAPGMKGGGQFISRGGNLLTQSGRAAVVGGAVGGAYGAGGAEGDLAERLPAAGDGAMTGAFVGTAVPGAARAVTAAVEPFAGPVVNMGKDVLRRMQGRDGVQPQDSARAEQIVREMAARARVTPQNIPQHPFVAAEREVTAAHLLGRDAQGQLAAIARRQGETGDILAGDVANRMDAAPGRVLDDFARMGVVPSAADDAMQAVVTQGRERAKPLFDEALGSDDPVTALNQFAERPVIRKALRDVYDDVLNAGEQPEGLGLKLVQRPMGGGGTIDEYIELNAPKAATWDKVRKATSNQVERNPLTGKMLPDSQSAGNRNVGVAARDLTKAMKDTIPGYAKAMDEAGDYMSVSGTFDRARGALFGNVTTRDFGKMFAGARTAPERDAIRSAMAADLYELAERGLLSPKRVLTPRAMGKLRLAFGAKADDLVNRLRAEQRVQGIDRRIMPGSGSPTAELTEAMRVQDGVVGPVAQLAQGRPVAAFGTAVANVLRSALKRPGLSEMERNELGRLLMMSPEELQAFLSSPAGRQTSQRLGLSGPAAGVLQPPRSQESQR